MIYPRTYSFFTNGRTYLGSEDCTSVSAARQIAKEFIGPKTHYVDVLDEGILVARIEK